MSTPENKVPEETPGAESVQETATGETQAAAEMPAITGEAPLGAAPGPAATGEAGGEAGTMPAIQLPEDLRAPWTWADLAIFAVFGFGSLLVLTDVLARIAADVWQMTPSQLMKFVTTSAGFVTLRQTVWFGVLLGYLYLVVRVRRGEEFWRTIGWRKLRIGDLRMPSAALLCVLGGFVLAIAVQYASGVVGKPTKLPIEALFQDRRSVLLVMSVGVLLAPVIEETIFRGFVYPVVARSLGVPLGVVCTGAMFGLMHAPQLWGGWGQIALLIAVGIVFTYVRARTGTVVATYFLHLGYNAILFLGFYFATGGLRYFPNQ